MVLDTEHHPSIQDLMQIITNQARQLQKQNKIVSMLSKRLEELIFAFASQPNGVELKDPHYMQSLKKPEKNFLPLTMDTPKERPMGSPDQGSTQEATSLPSVVAHPPTWASVAARNTRRIPRRRLMPESRAARLFSKPNPNSCFKFVYLPRRGRIPVHELRPGLQVLGVAQSRILHVHFPARNVTGLLIHSSFEKELLALLAKHNINVLSEFNPLSGTILQDPKFAKLDPTLRNQETRAIHTKRLVRIALATPYHVRASVAGSFIRQGLISTEEWVLSTAVSENDLDESMDERV